MVKVNFRTSDFRRQVADAGALTLKNRYYEENPFLSEDGASLIARPGMKKFIDLGEGPVRGLFSEAGSFDGDLFAVSYDTLYRINQARDVTSIRSGLVEPERGVINMAITGNIGDVPAYLFVADGTNLYVYADDGFAQGTLSGTPVATDVVRMSNMYYSFTAGSVDAGSPAGTVGNPWLVSLGLNTAAAFENLARAVNNTGNNGVQYSTALVTNPDVNLSGTSATSITIRASAFGIPGNAVITTETGAGLAWSSGTLTGGGDPSISVVETPDNVGVIDVAVINSFVIVIPAQTEGMIGRFYWIEPGETTIDPLNFATAERSPDAIYGVEVVGDQFWLPGESTTEVWYVSENPDARMQRLQGVVFDRGTWDNTPVAVHETLVICDADGGVFLIQGNSPQRVSTPDIEEQIREAIQYQASQII